MKFSSACNLAVIGTLALVAGTAEAEQICQCSGHCKAVGDPHIHNFQKKVWKASLGNTAVDMYKMGDLAIQLMGHQEGDIQHHEFIKQVLVNGDVIADSDTCVAQEKIASFDKVISEDPNMQQRVQGWVACQKFDGPCPWNPDGTGDCPFFLNVQIWKLDTFPSNTPVIAGGGTGSVADFLKIESSLGAKGKCMDKLDMSDETSRGSIICECGGTLPPTSPFSAPTGAPTGAPTTASPTGAPTPQVTDTPTQAPTPQVTVTPTQAPTPQVTITQKPTPSLTLSPTTTGPTPSPSCPPQCLTEAPTMAPSHSTAQPSAAPTPGGGSSGPTPSPTQQSQAPSMAPTVYCPPECRPTPYPTSAPTPTSPPTSPFDTPTSAPTTRPSAGPSRECTCTGTCKAYADPHIETMDGSKYITKAAGTNITLYAVANIMELTSYVESKDTREYQKKVFLNDKLIMDADNCENGKSVPFNVSMAQTMGINGGIKGTVSCNKGPKHCSGNSCQWYLDVELTKTDKFESTVSSSSSIDFMAMEKQSGATGECMNHLSNAPNKHPWKCTCDGDQ